MSEVNLHRQVSVTGS